MEYGCYVEELCDLQKKDKVMLELKSLPDKQWSKDTEASQWENEQRENEVYKYYTCKMQAVW